jgi:hypothetical protein
VFGYFQCSENDVLEMIREYSLKGVFEKKTFEATDKIQYSKTTMILKEHCIFEARKPSEGYRI